VDYIRLEVHEREGPSLPWDPTRAIVERLFGAVDSFAGIEAGGGYSGHYLNEPTRQQNENNSAITQRICSYLFSPSYPSVVIK